MDFLFFSSGIGTGAPAIQKTPLAFCPYNGKVCCDSAKDLELRKNFLAMNISDSGCASLVKSILCAVSSYLPCFVQWASLVILLFVAYLCSHAVLKGVAKRPTL